MFEELGGRVGGDNQAAAQYRKSHSGKSTFAVRVSSLRSGLLAVLLCRPSTLICGEYISLGFRKLSRVAPHCAYRSSYFL